MIGKTLFPNNPVYFCWPCCHTLFCRLSNSRVILVELTMWQLPITCTHSGGSPCHCRSSVTPAWPLRLSRVDEVITQLFRISVVPDSWLLRVCVCVCVYANDTPGQHTVTRGTRQHKTVTHVTDSCRRTKVFDKSELIIKYEIAEDGKKIT